MRVQAVQAIRKLKDTMRRFLPSFDRYQLAIVVFVLAIDAVFLSIVVSKNEFVLADPFVISSFAVKVLFDVVLTLLGVLALKALFRVAWPAAVFLAFVFLLSVANILLYYFGNTMLERHHFALISTYSVTAFVPWWALLGIFAVTGASVALFRRIVAGIAARDLWQKCVTYVLVLALLTAYNASGAFVKKGDERLDRVIMGFRNAQVYYACRNQVLSLLKDVAFPALGDELKSLAPATEEFVNDYNFSSDRFQVASDPSAYRATIDAWGLSIGGPDSPPLNLKPFTRIIYILAESVSLDALPCFNGKLNAKYAADFFCRKDVQQATFSNLYTSGSPTLQGLTVLFDGHPNYTVQEPTGHPTAFPRMLAQRGYRTVFMRSASEYFANENLVFRNMGFSEIVGREDFYDDPDLRKYIYGWGLEDRILYSKALEAIEKWRDDKLFLAIFGTDTHPPDGQVEYRHLKYPDKSQFQKNVPSGIFQWARSIDRMDFDLSEFLKALEKKKLFDENTLIIVSADHSCPINNVTAKIPGHPKTNLARIPLVFLSKQPLPDAPRDALASQADLAPTLFHLMGLPRDAGWWGRSLFDPARRPYAVGLDKGFVHFVDDSKDVLIQANQPDDDAEKDFLDLFYTVFKKAPGAP